MTTRPKFKSNEDDFLTNNTISNDVLMYHCVTQSDDNNDVFVVFENINIPKVLFSISKEEELEYFRRWGMMDILKMTWFCHRPVLGMTCGLCGPCKDALNEGMSWRVSHLGRFLGILRFVLNLPKRSLKKILRIFNDKGKRKH